MKFIGQYIQDFIARFRSDVYLEDVSTGTIASGGNLGLDSNNKIVKNTVGGGTTDLTSDVTGILPVANGGTGQNSLGSVNISDLNNDSGFTSNTGDVTSVAISESSNTRTVSSGSATIHFVDGEGIDLASSTLGANDIQLTISGEDASDSNKGIVELATTGEADTGTDTARAVTPAGLKSHVDARYHYQYISFLGNSTVQANGDWEFPGGNGISNHTWTIDANESATTVGSTTISVAKQYQHAGVRVPYAGKLVGIYGAGRNANGDRQFAAGLFVGVPDWGTTNSINATLRAYAAADKDGGTFNNVAAKVEDLSRDFTLSAGDMIYPAIRGDGSTGDTIQISMTVVIKTLIP